MFPAYATLPDKIGWYLLRGVGVLVLLFLLLPILVIMPLSFSASSFLSYPMPGWSLQWYDNLFSSDDWARATRNSFIVAPLATVTVPLLATMPLTTSVPAATETGPLKALRELNVNLPNPNFCSPPSTDAVPCFRL